MNFQDLLAQNGSFGGKIGEGVMDAVLIPNEFVLTFGGCYLCVTFCENRSRNVTVRVHRHSVTETN